MLVFPRYSLFDSSGGVDGVSKRDIGGVEKSTGGFGGIRLEEGVRSIPPAPSFGPVQS